jgi:diguanylate cyclase (GGDEF)-like protein
MMASGETTGLFHIETLEPDLFTSEVQELIRSVGERISLTLSNINLREKLRAQSTRDPLTGLFNRRYMEESLQRELSRARRKQSTVAVIMLDIDHFKKFNDMFGHDAGDAVLVQMGALLRTHIRSEDIACRYGGEEFMLILPDASLEVTRERAERILELVHNMQVIYHKESLGTVTVSAGVAAFPIHSQLSDEVLKAADQALYQAKSKGRNCVEVAPVPAV